MDPIQCDHCNSHNYNRCMFEEYPMYCNDCGKGFGKLELSTRAAPVAIQAGGTSKLNDDRVIKVLNELKEFTSRRSYNSPLLTTNSGHQVGCSVIPVVNYLDVNTELDRLIKLYEVKE